MSASVEDYKHNYNTLDNTIVTVIIVNEWHYTSSEFLACVSHPKIGFCTGRRRAPEGKSLVDVDDDVTFDNLCSVCIYSKNILDNSSVEQPFHHYWTFTTPGSQSGHTTFILALWIAALTDAILQFKK